MKQKPDSAENKSFKNENPNTQHNIKKESQGPNTKR